MIARENGGQRPAREELLADGDQCLRVLVADHDGLARRMMRVALRRASRIAIVLSAGEGREALELACYYHPDVVIIDTALPPDGGDPKMYLEMTLVDNHTGLTLWHAHQLFPANPERADDMSRAGSVTFYRPSSWCRAQSGQQARAKMR